MTQQDYTAPEMSVKVSRKERFALAFALFIGDEQHPDTSVNVASLRGDLLDASGTRQAQASLSKPDDHVMLVEVPTAVMHTLRPGRYRLEVYAQTGQEREDLVTVLMTIE